MTTTINNTTKTITVTGTRIHLTAKAKALAFRLENQGYQVVFVVK